MPHKQGEKMRGKKGLLFSFVTLILALGVFATVMFAWYSSSQPTSEFMLETGNIDATVTLYRMSEWDSGTSKYKTVKEVGTSKDAENVFSKLVPGQIVTLALEIKVSDDTDVEATYEIKFGDFFKGTVSSGVASYGSTAETVASAELDIFDAIKVKTFDLINGKVASVSHTDVHDLAVCKTVEDFGAVTDAEALSEYIGSANNTLVAKGANTLTKGAEKILIIKFYFDPTVNDKNSNPFANQCIKISNLTINFEQVHKVTE